MLNTRIPRGFTLIELLVGISVLALLLALGAPSFATYMQNRQIRAMSDSVLNGMQLARAEAVRRNSPVRFQLMTTLDSSCALSTSGRNWVVSMDSAAGNCGSTNMADAPSPVAPRMIQSRPGTEGTANAVVAADVSSLTFNGFGRVTTALPGGQTVFNVGVSNPTGGACKTSSGPMRCLRIVITPAGQVRMCDPSTTGTTESC
jgi:type IV fimbrial biogenesis protein FimT